MHGLERRPGFRECGWGRIGAPGGRDEQQVEERERDDSRESADRKLQTALRASVDGKAKPPGSLGRIEDLAVRLGLIQGRLDPRLERVLPAITD